MNDSGVVYVYENYVVDENHVPGSHGAVTLVADDGARGDRFGGTVGIVRDDGGSETILVAAKGHSRTGTAYVFEDLNGDWSDGSEQIKLTDASEVTWSDPLPQRKAGFGFLAAIGGETIAIWAIGTDTGYVFEKEPEPGGWVQTEAMSDMHGDVAVSDDGDTIVFSEASSAGVYAKAQDQNNDWYWQRQDTLEPFGDVKDAIQFGVSIDIASPPNL